MYTGFVKKSWELNELQLEILPHIQRRNNLLICAKTGAGKTQAITMKGYPLLKKGKKILYFGIMKSLVEEKYNDFVNPKHPWAKHYHVACISGDFGWDAKQYAKVQRADVICITPESFLSLIKSTDERKKGFLKGVRLIVPDEVHLVGSQGRGAAYETAIAEAARHCPRAQILALSGTVPNPQDFVAWFTNVNGKPTDLIVSDFMPVPIEYHYIPFDASGSQPYTEKVRIGLIESIMSQKKKKDEQFMICVWRKVFGEKIKEHLTNNGVWTGFHSANSYKDERHQLESLFKKKAMRCMVHTTTLSTGVNMPTPNMIVSTMAQAGEDIPYYDIMQAAGRAGRQGFCEKGDVYFLIPDNDYERHVKRLEEGEPIISTMRMYEELAAHFLGAIYKGVIVNQVTYDEWFKRTLAFVQTSNYEEVMDECWSDMVKKRMIKEFDAEQKIELTRRGTICAQLMLNPYDFAIAIDNFRRYTTKDSHMREAGFIQALTYIPSHKGGSVDTYMWRKVCEKFPKAIDLVGGTASQYMAAAIVIACRLNKQFSPPELNSVEFKIMDNLSRLSEGLVRAAKEAKEFDMDEVKFSRYIFRMVHRLTGDQAISRVGILKPSEVRVMARARVGSLTELSKRREIMSEVMSLKRMKELNLV